MHYRHSITLEPESIAFAYQVIIPCCSDETYAMTCSFHMQTKDKQQEIKHRTQTHNSHSCYTTKCLRLTHSRCRERERERERERGVVAEPPTTCNKFLTLNARMCIIYSVRQRKIDEQVHNKR